MINVLEKNGMNNEEFKAFCLNYHESKSQKEIDWTDFTFFVLGCINENEDMGFTKAELYKDGSCFEEDKELIQYAGSENEIWDKLFKLIGKEDYEIMEEDFEYCKWEDLGNTCIAKFKGNEKEYAILRM